MNSPLRSVLTGLDWRNPDYVSVVAKRNDNLQTIRTDPGILSAAFTYYRDGGIQSTIDFITDWLWTYDPRRGQAGSLIPFLMFPKQIEFLEWYQDRVDAREGGLTEKSRDVGVTNLVVAWSLKHWLFGTSAIQIAFGSYKEALVDCMGAPNSILEKFRAMCRHIPAEFLPQYTLESQKRRMYDERKDARFMLITNKENGCTLIGEGGENIGRGGRSFIYNVDESAHLSRPLQAAAALSANADIIFHHSSVNGPAGMNVFADMRFGGSWKVFVFPWESDPRKTKEWYAKLLLKYKHAPHIVASEYDRAYDASVEGILIPTFWVKACVEAHLDPINGWDPNGFKKAGLDVADEGADNNALALVNGNWVVEVSEWHEGTTTETAILAYTKAELFGARLLNFDSIGVGAGVKGALGKLLLNKPEKIRLDVFGINVGSRNLPGWFAKDVSNADTFANLKAMLWWRLRVMCENTYNRIVMGKQVPWEDCISLPSNPQLHVELSSPKWSVDTRGKIIVESKKAMKKRGINSTNQADALVLGLATQIGRRAKAV